MVSITAGDLVFYRPTRSDAFRIPESQDYSPIGIVLRVDTNSSWCDMKYIVLWSDCSTAYRYYRNELKSIKTCKDKFKAL